MKRRETAKQYTKHKYPEKTIKELNQENDSDSDIAFLESSNANENDMDYVLKEFHSLMEDAVQLSKDFAPIQSPSNDDSDIDYPIRS